MNEEKYVCTLWSVVIVSVALVIIGITWIHQYKQIKAFEYGYEKISTSQSQSDYGWKKAK